jgi:putative transposase
VSLYAKGLTTGEIQAHLAEIYGAEVSRDTISRVTDAVAAELDEWRSRPLDRIYAVVMIDCIYVKIRDGAMASRLLCRGRHRPGRRPRCPGPVGR